MRELVIMWLVMASATASADRSGLIEVNGVKLYYETRGSGAPVVVLHGGTSTIEHSFGKLVPELSKRYLVIGIEQVGHGQTALWGRMRTWSAREIASVKMPILIVAGDREPFLSASDAAAMATAMPDAALAILPNTEHDTFNARPAWLLLMIKEFLSAPTNP